MLCTYMYIKFLRLGLAFDCHNIAEPFGIKNEFCNRLVMVIMAGGLLCRKFFGTFVIQARLLFDANILFVI